MKSDEHWHILVLKKIKKMIVSDEFSGGEAIYRYEWDEDKELKHNLALADREHAVLAGYIDRDVVDGVHRLNEYKKQQSSVSGGIWSDWNEQHPSRKEFYYETFIYGVDYVKFQHELEIFNLEEVGVDLVERKALVNDELPLSQPVTVLKDNRYKIHAANRITFKGKEIKLDPQVRKVVVLIMNNSESNKPTNRATIEHACEVYDVPHVITRARSAFKNAVDGKNHFFNKRNIGYYFKG